MCPKVTEEHREQRRREILDAAARVFKKKGYENTTMQDIIDESGISRGGVYFYFSGREQLFQALLDQLDEDQGQELGFLHGSNESVWEAVKLFLKLEAQEIADVSDSLIPIILEYFIIDWREKAKHPYLVNRYQTAVRQISAFLQIGVESGEFQPLVPVEQIARHAVTFLDGLIMESIHVGPEQVNTEQQLDLLRQSLKHFLHVQELEEGT